MQVSQISPFILLSLLVFDFAEDTQPGDEVPFAILI